VDLVDRKSGKVEKVELLKILDLKRPERIRFSFLQPGLRCLVYALLAPGRTPTFCFRE
jgi:hypothetical protein